MTTLAPPASSAPVTGRHALIIEDDLITGLDLQAMLQSLGYGSFAFASTAAQALEQAKLRAPDLTTVDVGLMDGDGLGAASALAALFGDTPTIFITGDPQTVRDGGARRVVLGKPVTALDLRRAVDQAFSAPIDL